MKKIYYFMLALILPTLALVSCGSDDDDALTKYNWGIYPTEEVPIKTWIQDMVDEFAKNYNGKGSFDTDEPALAKYTEGTRALQQLKENFDHYVETHDISSSSFSLDYVFRVYKDGAILKESPACKLEYENTRDVDFQVAADRDINIDIDDIKDQAEASSVYEETIKVSDLKLPESNAGYQIRTDDILWVNANTFEYAYNNPFKTFEIIDGDKEKELRMITSNLGELKMSEISAMVGDWYMLIPITVNGAKGSITYDVKIFITIK